MIPGPNPFQQPADEYFMYEALRESLNGLGWTTPNPLVGCVIVRAGEIIGRGHHHSYGGKHAEVMAIHNCRDGCAGATAYVNLEPCTHVAHQGACCVALHKAGVSRVVYASEDTDPRTAGKARAVLVSSGIEVASGILVEQSERLLDYYHHAKVRQRPFVHLKVALSLDGKLACANGASQWLSGPSSLGYAHYLRQKYDAVLVGIGTVLQDNPRLTTRRESMAPYLPLPDGVEPSNPVRVVLDPRFRSVAMREELRLFDTGSGQFREGRPRVIIAGLDHECPQDVNFPVGLELLGLAAADGLIDFSLLFKDLWRFGLCSILVEGGSRLAAELIRQRQVDKFSLVYTPRLLGSDALGFSPALGLQDVGDGLRVLDVWHETLGEDILINGYHA